MTCKETQSLIPMYISETMDKDTLLEFISHIRECRECYNELETFFMIDRALTYLNDEEEHSYALQNLLDQDLNRRWSTIRRDDTINMLTIFSIVLMLISLILMTLDMYGIFSLSYLL